MPTQVKVGWRSFVSPVTSSYLLDSYSSAAAAYSLRKLRTAYTGNAIRVRRSSDNGEQNIGFDANGNLDTASLLSFVGAGNGFVTTWYDQSGSSKDVTQATAANQPKIVNAGSIILKNNKPAIDFTWGQFLRGNHKVIGDTAVSVFNIFSIKNPGQRVFAWDIGNNTINQYYAFDINTYFTPTQSFGFYINTLSAYSNQATNLNQNLLSVISNTTAGLPIASNTFYYINNASKTLTSTYGSGTQTFPSYAGASRISIGNLNGENYYFDGQHQELVIYTTNKSSDLSSINTAINSYYSIYSTLDTDAQAFVTAAGITDATQVSAVNTLVTSLKSANIWTKMKALYPFVGGSATSHKFNLKDPRDLNEAFRLVFTGGWTHTSTGALPNGSNGYANTYLVPSNNFPISQYDAHISLYSRTNIEAPTTNWLSGSIGVDDDYNSGAYFVLNVNSKTTRIVQGRTLGNQWTTYSGPLDDSRGFFIINKQNNTTLKLKKNDTLLSSNTTLSTGQYRPAQNFYIGAVNGSQSYSGLNYDNKEYGFISIGDGLSDAEAAAFYNAVQAFQTSLGRQV